MLLLHEREATATTQTFKQRSNLLGVPPLIIVTKQARHDVAWCRQTIQRMSNLKDVMRIANCDDIIQLTFHNRLSIAIVS
jgi:hypothetical protein